MELTGSLAGMRGGRLLMGVLFAMIGLGLSWVITTDPDTAVALVLALGVGFFILRHPAIGVLIILVTTSTIISPQVLPQFSIGGADIVFTEFLLLLTTVVVVIRTGVRTSFRRCFGSRLMLPLLLFLALIVVSIFYSLSQYADLPMTTVIARTRQFFYYLLFIPALLAIRDGSDLKLFVKGLLLLTFLVSIYFIYTAVFGQTYLHYLLRTGIRFAVTGVDTGEVSGTFLRNARLRDIPGTAIVVSLFFVAIALFLYQRSSRSAIWYGGLSALFTAPILLTFTRITWATTLAIFPILWLILRKRAVRLTKLAFTMGAGFLLVFLALALHPKYSEIIGLTVGRLESLYEENIETSTAVWRMVEMKAALDEVEQHPLTGMGVAGEFVRKKVEYEGREFVLINRFGIHNAYLGLALKAGIPCLLVFLVLYLLALSRAVRAFRRSDDPFIKAVAIGLFLGLLRSLLNAVSQPYFLEIAMIPCLAVSFALIEVMNEMAVADDQGPGETGTEIARARMAWPRSLEGEVR